MLTSAGRSTGNSIFRPRAFGVCVGSSTFILVHCYNDALRLSWQFSSSVSSSPTECDLCLTL